MIEYIGACLVAVLLHEIAHFVVARSLGIRVKRFGIDWRGPYMIREQGEPLACIFTALAGPAMNLAIAATFWKMAPQFGLVNIILGGYNLLPFVPGLDGHNALGAYRRLSASNSSLPS
jgi:Zn-dependent protease